MEKLQEQKLRAFIRAGIIKKKKERLEEQFKQALNKNKLRSIIKNILLTEATDVNTDTPNRSTGINVLATTLKLVIPIIKQGYEQLTSSPEQRKSFRAHVIQNAINTLVRVDLTTGSEEETRAGDEEREEVVMPDNPEVAADEIEVEEPVEELEEQDIDIEVGADDEEKFIDIEGDDEVEEPEPEEGEGEEAPEEGEGEEEMELEESQEDLQEAMVNRIAKRVAARLLKEKSNN